MAEGTGAIERTVLMPNTHPIRLSLNGLGIIFYSPPAVAHIREGENYLRAHYQEPEHVVQHIRRGTLVGFGTGSAGVFELRFHIGYPESEVLRRSPYKLRLALRCEGRTVCFRDLYDLVNWDPNCPEGQTIQLEDGIYHVTICSDLPRSGIIGDNQIIEVYFQPLDALPYLTWNGVPILCR